MPGEGALSPMSEVLTQKCWLGAARCALDDGISLILSPTVIHSRSGKRIQLPSRIFRDHCVQLQFALLIKLVQMLAKRSHVDFGAQALDATVGNLASFAWTKAIVCVRFAVVIRVGTRLQDDSFGQSRNANMDHQLLGECLSLVDAAL